VQTTDRGYTKTHASKPVKVSLGNLDNYMGSSTNKGKAATYRKFDGPDGKPKQSTSDSKRVSFFNNPSALGISGPRDMVMNLPSTKSKSPFGFPGKQGSMPPRDKMEKTEYGSKFGASLNPKASFGADFLNKSTQPKKNISTTNQNQRSLMVRSQTKFCPLSKATTIFKGTDTQFGGGGNTDRSMTSHDDPKYKKQKVIQKTKKVLTMLEASMQKTHYLAMHFGYPTNTMLNQPSNIRFESNQLGGTIGSGSPKLSLNDYNPY
jgi:hypothetical protein